MHVSGSPIVSPCTCIVCIVHRSILCLFSSVAPECVRVRRALTSCQNNSINIIVQFGGDGCHISLQLLSQAGHGGGNLDGEGCIPFLPFCRPALLDAA